MESCSIAQCEAQVHSGVAPAQEQPFGLEHNLEGVKMRMAHRKKRAVANRTDVSYEVDVNKDHTCAD